MTDLRFALRLVWKQRSSALVAVLSLGLAVGGAIAMFSILNAVVRRSSTATSPKNPGVREVPWPPKS